MIIASMILSCLALLAAVVIATLFLVYKKRESERRQALLDYIDNVAGGVHTSVEELIDEKNKAMEQLFTMQHKALQLEISKLKDGVTPDYQKAMDAAKAVNDFNAGIISIMNFDPIEVARRSRTNGTKEDE